MIDPLERSIDCFDHWQTGSLRALDHDHLDAEVPCRLDLAVSRIAAAILGDDYLDSMPLQQVQFVRQSERASAGDVADIGHRQRRLDGIDAADPILVLRRRIGQMRLLPASRQENAQGQSAERGHGLRNTMHREPVIALDRHPGRTAQRKSRHIALNSHLRSIGGDAGCERMGGVYQQIDPFILKITSKTLRAAETAAAHRNGLRRRISGPARERQDNVKIGAGGKPRRQSAGLGRTAQDQYADLAHG